MKAFRCSFINLDCILNFIFALSTSFEKINFYKCAKVEFSNVVGRLYFFKLITKTRVAVTYS